MYAAVTQSPYAPDRRDPLAGLSEAVRRSIHDEEVQQARERAQEAHRMSDQREPIILNVPVNDPTFDPETEEVVQYPGEPFPRIRRKANPVLAREPYRTVADREHEDGWHRQHPDPQCWGCANAVPHGTDPFDR